MKEGRARNAGIETASRDRGVTDRERPLEDAMIALPERLNLPYTDAVARATSHLHSKIARTVTPAEWELYAPYVARIEELKRERNAIVLAHHYQSAEIYGCVSDVVGDSLALAQAAASTDADAIVMCGVHFMAE